MIQGMFLLHQINGAQGKEFVLALRAMGVRKDQQQGGSATFNTKRHTLQWLGQGPAFRTESNESQDTKIRGKARHCESRQGNARDS